MDAAAAMTRIFPSALARGRYFIPQSVAMVIRSGEGVTEGSTHALGDQLGGFDVMVGEVDDTQDDLLVAEVLEDAKIETGLCGLDRDLVGREPASREEGVPGRAGRG